jgi:glycosyltransferase involved in cell wall biosynthesis
VRILPPESSAPALFASSHVSIGPLFQGGGVRIKIPESLAVGCPVVATEIGAEGHDLPGLTRTDDPEAFAVACLDHLRGQRTPEAREELRAAVEARYGAAVVARRLVEFWIRTIEEEAALSHA